MPVTVVYNAIDTVRFAPGVGDGARLDGLAGLPAALEGTVRVGLVATYARWKGQDLFMMAISRVQSVRPARFYIVGGPIYKTAGSQFSEEELRELAGKLGVADRLAFVPFQAETADAFRALDVVIHASTHPEPFGRTIVEAMACSRPVVVANAGGASELFTEGKDALGVTPGDPDALAQAMDRLIDNEHRAPRDRRTCKSDGPDPLRQGETGARHRGSLWRPCLRGRASLARKERADHRVPSVKSEIERGSCRMDAKSMSETVQPAAGVARPSCTSRCLSWSNPGRCIPPPVINLCPACANSMTRWFARGQSSRPADRASKPSSDQRPIPPQTPSATIAGQAEGPVRGPLAVAVALVVFSIIFIILYVFYRATVRSLSPSDARGHDARPWAPATLSPSWPTPARSGGSRART